MRLIIFARLALAGLGGVLVYFSHEPNGYFYAAIAGIALLSFALMPWNFLSAASGPSARSGALIGFTHALCVYLPLLPWVGEFVGSLPWIALSVACATYSVITGAFGALVMRWRCGFAAFPLVYVAVEYVLSSFPFGGFSWVRLAWGQINGPLAHFAPLGGPALVTFATVVMGTALAEFVRTCAVAKSQRLMAAAPAALILSLPITCSIFAGVIVDRPEPTTGEVTVGAVQGNVPRMGLDFNAQRRAVLANHVNVTKELAADLESNGEEVDMVFWPENASDVNPFMDEQAFDAITGAVDAVGAPVLVGTLTKDEVGDRNTAVVFDPHDGPGDIHNKKYLQPFGEWMPWRDFFRNFSEYVDMAGDFKPGDGNGTVRMGDHIVGIATCYEVAFDMAYRDAVKAGARILTTPTNNATFGFTDMTYQQLAMSRFRALETDRAVVIAATSGVSAIVHPDGRVSQHTEIFQPGYLVETLPLRDSVTFAVKYGRLIQWLLVVAGIAVMVVSVAGARRGYASSEHQAL